MSTERFFFLFWTTSFTLQGSTKTNKQNKAK